MPYYHATGPKRISPDKLKTQIHNTNPMVKVKHDDNLLFVEVKSCRVTISENNFPGDGH
jgi:hypothetical protein